MTPFLLALLVAASPPPVSYQRSIDVSGATRARVVLDALVYEHAREDLGDLRVQDGGGVFVPFLLVRGVDERAESVTPKILNRVFVKRKSLTATLDFGQRVPKEALLLRTGGDSFRRRVSVEGSDDGVAWRSLVEGAYIFAIPGPPAARYEAVALPSNDFPFLRLTIENDRDDPEVLDLLEVRVEGARPGRERVVPSTHAIELDATKKETHVLLDLGRERQPFVAVELAVAQPRFFRAVLLEAADSTAPAPGFRVIARSGVYRYDTGGASSEALRIPATGRARKLRVRVLDGDDRSLAMAGAIVLGPEDAVVFEPVTGQRYTLSYGLPSRERPVFDLEKVVTDPGAWATEASPATLGPELTRDESASRPWSERYPALLWGGLVAAVVALGLLTLRALRHPS